MLRGKMKILGVRIIDHGLWTMGRHFLSSILLSICIFCFISSSSEARVNCLKCHPQVRNQLSQGNVHKPLRKRNCTICHSTHASDQPHLLVKPTKELCLSCHKKAFKVKYPHMPVMEGDCDKCHAPHASPYTALLKKQEREICFDCHQKEKIFLGKKLHNPVKKCLSCHKAHGSNYPGLLNKPLKGLCFTCHQKTKIIVQHKGSALKGNFCLSCHNAHSSKKSHLLRTYAHSPYAKGQCQSCHLMQGKKVGKVKSDNRLLCLTCHPQVENADHFIYSHIQLTPGSNVCLDCHTPHLSDIKPSLKGSPKQICFSCHRDTKNRLLSNSPGFKYKHPEAKKGNCLVCHQGHGSNKLFLLKEGGINTCTSCHKRHARFTHPIGEKAIDPRCKTKMDCVTCHHPMGAKDIYNIIFDHREELCIQCHKIST